MIVWLVAASIGVVWTPPSGGPSAVARRVLDSIPEPRTIAIPAEVERQSRRGVAPPSAALPPAATPLPAGGCYEIQLTALADADRAAALAREAGAQLGVDVRAVESAGLWRLRAGSCLDGAAAQALRDRARASGYPGAFAVPSR